VLLTSACSDKSLFCYDVLKVNIFLIRALFADKCEVHRSAIDHVLISGGRLTEWCAVVFNVAVTMRMCAFVSVR